MGKQLLRAIHQGDLKPETASNRTFYPENNYIDEVPCSKASAKIIDAGEYSDDELGIRLARDFEQELLWHSRKSSSSAPFASRTRCRTFPKARP